jgi:multidrug resistance efflux pump
MKNIFKQLKRTIVWRTLLIILVVGLVVGGYVYYEKNRDRIFIDTSLVSATIVTIGPAAPEKLTEQDAYEGERINKGDTIAKTDSQTFFADTDGLIVLANNQIGGIVSQQNPIAQLINLSDMRIAGTIDENKGLNQVKIGQVASFTVDALPGREFFGYVDEISPSAKQTQLAFSISSERPTQQFVIYARFDASKYPEIKNGMSAKMTVYTKTK